METRKAKLFKNGASQAIRLPASFRFEGPEVYIRRDLLTGDVVLTSRPGARTWNDFYELMSVIEVPGDFMSKRPLNQVQKDRILFHEED